MSCTRLNGDWRLANTTIICNIYVYYPLLTELYSMAVCCVCLCMIYADWDFYKLHQWTEETKAPSGGQNWYRFVLVDGR